MSPEISHQALRWRMDHTQRLDRTAALGLGAGLMAMWAGWWVVLRVMLGVAGVAAPEWVSRLLILGPVGAAVVAVAVGLTVRRWNWTEIVADPHALALRGPVRQRRWAWSEILGFRLTPVALVIDTARGPVYLDRGSATPSVLGQVVGWLEVGRTQGFDRVPEPPPPPPQLERLRARHGSVG